jgi:hypothetical protein
MKYYGVPMTCAVVVAAPTTRPPCPWSLVSDDDVDRLRGHCPLPTAHCASSMANGGHETMQLGMSKPRQRDKFLDSVHGDLI